MSKYILAFILCLLNSIAFAGSTIGIRIQFDNTNFTDPAVGSADAPITCSGEKQGYKFLNTLPVVGTNKLEITFTGPFDGDKREFCTLSEDKVYFVVTNLKVHFKYNGNPGTCIIRQGIGTGWDTFHSNNDKLQGDTKDTKLYCANSNDYQYQLTPGSAKGSYDKGHITIYYSPRTIGPR